MFLWLFWSNEKHFVCYKEKFKTSLNSIARIKNRILTRWNLFKYSSQNHEKRLFASNIPLPVVTEDRHVFTFDLITYGIRFSQNDCYSHLESKMWPKSGTHNLTRRGHALASPHCQWWRVCHHVIRWQMVIHWNYDSTKWQKR